jgi:hypothetical protein
MAQGKGLPLKLCGGVRAATYEGIPVAANMPILSPIFPIAHSL